MLSVPPKLKILSIIAKKCWKIEIELFLQALFHTNNIFCLIYFGQDCLWKQYFASNSTQTPSNLTCFNFLVNLRHLTLVYLKRRVSNLQKSDKICSTWQLLFISFHWGPNLVLKAFKVLSRMFFERKKVNFSQKTDCF